MKRTRKMDESSNGKEKEGTPQPFISCNPLFPAAAPVSRNMIIIGQAPMFGLPPELGMTLPSSTRVSVNNMLVFNTQMPVSSSGLASTTEASNSQFPTNANGQTTAVTPLTASGPSRSSSPFPENSNRAARSVVSGTSMTLDSSSTKTSSTLLPAIVSNADTGNNPADLGSIRQEDRQSILDNFQQLGMTSFAGCESKSVQAFVDSHNNFTTCLPLSSDERRNPVVSFNPHDTNNLSFMVSDSDSDNKEKLHQIFKTPDQQKLMGVNDISAEILNHSKPQPLPPATVSVTEQHISHKANFKRKCLPEADISSTLTSATAATESKMEQGTPPEAGSTSSISSASSTEEAHSSGVTSNNGSLSAKRGRTVSDDQKDDLYWEKRRRNNESAKRSREARRRKNYNTKREILFLTHEVTKIRAEIGEIEKSNADVTDALLRRQAEAKSRQKQGAGEPVYDYSQQHLPHQRPPPPGPSGAGAVI